MIRFNCPACGASYTAPPSDAGKSAECNACRTEFEIPLGPPVPPKRKLLANEPVEVHPCPKCSARLSVLASDLGSDIECPSCQTVYPAVNAAAPAPPPPRKSSAGKSKTVERDDPDEDEDDRPKKRKSKRRKSSTGLRDDRYRTFSPHDGVLMLILSLVSFALSGMSFCCLPGAFAGFVLSLFVVFKGSLSIGEVKKGVMDPGGRVLQEIARALAILAILVAIGRVVIHFVVGPFNLQPDS